MQQRKLHFMPAQYYKKDVFEYNKNGQKTTFMPKQQLSVQITAVFCGKKIEKNLTIQKLLVKITNYC